MDGAEGAHIRLRLPVPTTPDPGHPPLLRVKAS
jgi:hypothetical protein